uniref:CARD domain-containing protein n=1 Tax=Fundulus heteroclitus TaxID=8078 RepID=A0A3Q2NNP8_FUNHE
SAEPWASLSYDEQLHSDTQYLCSHQGMDTELVDRLVLQLNRTYPQILSDKENIITERRAQTFPLTSRLVELLKDLHGKGDDACHEFYRALHIHAEDVYVSLPTRIRQRGPLFFLSCFSLAVGFAILYYYGEGRRLVCTEAFLHCSAMRLGKDAKDVFISYVEVGKQR